MVQFPYTKCYDTLPIRNTFKMFITECLAVYPPTGEYIHEHVQSRRILSLLLLLKIEENHQNKTCTLSLGFSSKPNYYIVLKHTTRW